MSIKQTALESP